MKLQFAFFSSLALSLKSNLTFATTSAASTNVISQNIIVRTYIVPAINFLSAGVGIIVVSQIIIGGIQYTTSANNPQAVSAAKNRIINALLALVAYALLYAFLNFIIPGGLVEL